MSDPLDGERTVKAVHGARPVSADPESDIALAEELRAAHSREELLELATEHAYRDSAHDARMRRAVWRALARRFGHGVTIGRAALMKHPETFEIGDGVFVGEQAFIQGRFDGRCVIGSHVWIGPQSYFDARDLVIGDHVGWGPGAKVLGSTHTALPTEVPIMRTDLTIKPVRVDEWADIGVNAVIMPGVTIGRGAIVGAGAVVVHDVEPFSIVAGVPARFLKWRPGHGPVVEGT
ncbi:MAG: acyltransferase [Vicinamibacterales bacterium]